MTRQTTLSGAHQDHLRHHRAHITTYRQRKVTATFSRIGTAVLQTFPEGTFKVVLAKHPPSFKLLSVLPDR